MNIINFRDMIAIKYVKYFDITLEFIRVINFPTKLRSVHSRSTPKNIWSKFPKLYQIIPGLPIFLRKPLGNPLNCKNHYSPDYFI